MQRVNIAIASPNDVANERAVVPRVFNRWNDANSNAFLHPVMWESAAVPAMGDHPQHILNHSIINKSDLLIAMFWSKLGTPTPTANSGTVEEIREFIKQKGPKRVMLYFCTRDLPYDIDPAELARLREFKSEMQSQGLYHQYATVEEFERDLYRHLDKKVEQFVSGTLPIPVPTDVDVRKDVSAKKQHPDARLRKPIDFGSTLADISAAFARRMDEFNAIDGAGPDKHLDLAAHVYTSAAICLDRFLAYSAGNVNTENRFVLEKLSTRLKRLAGAAPDYLKKPYPEYWDDGQKIADDLAAHVAHMNRLAVS